MWKLYSEAEASKYLGIYKLTLRSYRQAGKIIPSMAGKIHIYTQDDLDVFARTYLANIKAHAARVKFKGGCSPVCKSETSHK